MNKQKEPKLRFPGFTGEWVEKRLGDVVTSIGSGKTKPNGIGSYPVYGSMGIIGQSENHTHEGEFLLIARVGANAGSLNYVNDRFCVTDNTLILDVSKKDTIISFIHAALQNSNLSKLVFGSGQPLVTAGQLKSLSLYLPTLPEQKKIAEFLSEIDTKIEKLTRKKELTEQYKKGAMQKIFSQKIRFKDDNGKNYPEWEEKRLGDVCVLITKGTTPTSVGHNFVEEGINFIKAENISKNNSIEIANTPKITDECNNKLGRSILHENDILFSIAGTLGRTVVIKKEHLPANTNQALAIIRLRCSISTVFIYYSLIKEQVTKHINEILSVGAQPNLNLQQIGDFKIQYPCLEEQKKISDFLVDLDTRIEHINKELVTLKEFKKGLLQGMFV